ncbi:tetratricopeptide repeat protein [Acidovorax sp.]|uniref:tetratricopeptide repeat protein n=1 Tax=Acidovorax sp. TaxID=1872122 RepID=UPI0027B8A871|nr:tetratricopeptide repeat protein [Acidovorax sp.]
MSYTIQIWEKPADWPWPATKAEADAQYERAEAGPQVPMNPKFAAWAQAVEQRSPGFWDIYLGGPEMTDPTWGVGINTRASDWGAPFDDGWEQAVRLGLNLYDPQSGVHYLANGDAPEEPDLPVQRAARARKAGDDATAWAEYRHWAARGNPHALYALGRALRFGTMGQRRHFDLAAALQLMGAHDAETRKDAQAFFQRFPDEAKARIQVLMARLKSAPGEQLLQIIDNDRKAVDDAVARSQQLALYSRKRIEATDALEPAAAQGHEVAAFLHALDVVIGWEQPNFENARYWCQRAAEWDHEPAKRLLALMFERGWGGPVDMQEAAKWNAAAQEQRLRAQKKLQAQEKAESPGGLSLAPLAPASHASAAAAPVVWTGNPLRDLPGWYAREGDPHAAFHLGTSDEHGRYGGPVNLAQARAWYAQAAEEGHADATYNLGTFVESGKGGPKDVQVAKALFMLANTRGTTMQVADLRIAPNEQSPVRALVAALREPGRLRAVLQQRGLGAAVAAPGGAAPTAVAAVAASVAAAGLSASDWGRAGGAAPQAPRPAPPVPGPGPSRARSTREEDEDDEVEHAGRQGAGSRSGFSLHLGHLALVVGVANVVLLIAFFKPGASFRMGMFGLGLVAAFGAWRTARDFDWSPLARAVVAVLAAVPMVGMAVCLGLLFKAVRERG